MAVLGIVVLGGLGVAWRHLQFEDYFLSTEHAAPKVRSEVPSRNAGPPLHHFVWRVTERTTWGELAASPGLGLEPELVVESYRCTTGSPDIRFEAIRNRPIASGQQVTIVLSRGACPKREPAT
jgi:hypothetical protein